MDRTNRAHVRACLEIRPADVAAEVTRRVFCEDRAIFRLVTSAATISKHALRGCQSHKAYLKIKIEILNRRFRLCSYGFVELARAACYTG